MLPLGLIEKNMERLRGWGLEGSSIVKDYTLRDFKEALWFVNKVGELAEREEHHPDIVISYNKVRLTLTTHEEHGLTSKDFDLAEKIDKINF